VQLAGSLAGESLHEKEKAMRGTALTLHPGLAGSSRLPVLAQEGDRLQAAELLLLMGAGVAAGVTTAFFDFGLRIPGHAIIRAVFPMALGLALAPRRGGGMVMGASALGSALVINVGGFAAIGFGALTSLTLTGPFMDLALWGVKRGWRLYLGFALAGLASNLVALVVRAAPKWIGADHAIHRPLAEWLVPAMGTYAVCGVLAGLISACAWFQFAADKRSDANSEPAL